MACSYLEYTLVTHTYTGTTGSSFIDFVLCDPTACSPATAEDQFTEKIIFLPEPYFIAPMVPPRPPQITLDGEKLCFKESVASRQLSHCFTASRMRPRTIDCLGFPECILTMQIYLHDS